MRKAKKCKNCKKFEGCKYKEIFDKEYLINTCPDYREKGEKK